MISHRTVKDSLSLIGNTPLVRLKKIADEWGISDEVALFAKCEFMNPGGSIKDRPALNIIRLAETQGLMHKDKILLDATSGNTGIAYAMICAVKGYKCCLCVPESASRERKKILKAYGVEIIFTPAELSSDGAITKAKEIYLENPGRYFYADQYSNDANWQSHYNTTGPEIWEQTEGAITHFVAAIGTSGSFIGISRYLKKQLHSIECIGVQPDVALHGLEGIKHLETAMVPSIYDPTVANRWIEVSTEIAYAYAQKIPKVEGLLIGVSAAANIYASLKVAKELTVKGIRGTIVSILCDGGMKYLSEDFWGT